MAQGDEVVDEYVAATIERANEESDLSHVKREVCRATTRKRTVFYIVDCPEKESCSAASWKRNRPWSFDDPQRAVLNLKRHLMESSLHGLSDEEADMAAQTAHIGKYTHVPDDDNEPRRPPRQPGDDPRRQQKPPSTPPSVSHRSDAAVYEPHSSSSRQQNQRRTFHGSSHDRSRSRDPSRSPSRCKGKGKGKGKNKNDGPLTGGNAVTQSVNRHGFHGSVGHANVAALQKKIGDVSSQVAALQVADTRRRVAAPIQVETRTTIDVPKATAQTLNEALVRAVETSQHMRSTLESFDRAAKQNEELLSKAQIILSSVLGNS